MFYGFSFSPANDYIPPFSPVKLDPSHEAKKAKVTAPEKDEDTPSKKKKAGTTGSLITGVKNKMNDIKKKYEKAKNNEESNTTKVEKYKQKIKKYCEMTNSRRSEIILNARETISREIFKQFMPKDPWLSETYKVVKKDKQGKSVLDEDNNPMSDTKYVAHDIAELMRAVADLIDPINESAETLKDMMEEQKNELLKLLAKQAEEVEELYQLD